MPTYEYACKKCGEHLEVVQAFSDDPLTVCPNCKGALRKVFSGIGISFKGPGFYKTDSRTSGAKRAKDGATASESAASSTAADTGGAKGGEAQGTKAAPAKEASPAKEGGAAKAPKAPKAGAAAS